MKATEAAIAKTREYKYPMGTQRCDSTQESWSEHKARVRLPHVRLINERRLITLLDGQRIPA